MLIDKPLSELEVYMGSVTEPAGFDEFWSATLVAARAKAWPVRCVPVPHPFSHVVIQDIRFAGWDGEPINAWLRYPSDISGPFP
ncbi:MAG: acetylxylan esterase, partial [Propionibacteriaceae bacterium]|nr:acetylxylan esterase [Propionibacteriaceae bacterium]